MHKNSPEGNLIRWGMPKGKRLHGNGRNNTAIGGIARGKLAVGSIPFAAVSANIPVGLPLAAVNGS